MSEFRLPELDLTESATVSRWLKRPGESIGAHEKLLEVFSERLIGISRRRSPAS